MATPWDWAAKATMRLGSLQRLVARYRAGFQGEVLATQHHGDDAGAAFGNVVQLREGARMLDHGAETHAAHRHAALAFQLGHHLVEQSQVLHAFGLCNEERRQAWSHRGLDVGNGETQWAG